MAKKQIKKKREQRQQRQLERQVEQALGNGPSEGMFCVYNKTTQEYFKGLNFDQAVDKWNSLENAIILRDEDVRNG